MIFQTATPPETRPYIPDTTVRAIDAFTSGKEKFSISIPPRSGKTDIAYLLAGELRASADIPFFLLLSPWVFLQEQALDEEKLKKHIKLYQRTKNILTCIIKSYDSSEFWKPRKYANRPTIYSGTTAMAYSRRGGLARAIKFAIEDKGVRPVVVFDEAHILSNVKEMGVLYRDVIGAGAFCLLMTGTPFRSDNKPVIGLNRREGTTETSEASCVNHKRISDQLVTKKFYEGTTTRADYYADHTISWRDAWKVGALLKAHASYIEVDVDIPKGGETKPLSKWKRETIRPERRRIFESPEYINKLAEVTVDELAAIKCIGGEARNAAAMVVVGSDDLSEDVPETNRQAKQVKNALESYCQRTGRGDWSVQIATMSSEDGRGGDRLKEFQGGAHDILIVKLMGLVGLDMERLMVLSMASTLSSGPLIYQLLTRPLTPWSDVTYIPRLVLPGDKIMRDSYDEVITAEGGDAETVDTDLKLVEEETVEDEAKPRPDIGISNARVTDVHDTEGLVCEGDRMAVCARIRQQYPSARSLSDPILYQGYTEGAFTIKPQEDAQFEVLARTISVDDALATLREDFNARTKEIADGLHSRAHDPDAWRRSLSHAAGDAKRAAGIAVALGDETDPDKLHEALKYLYARLGRTYVPKV